MLNFVKTFIGALALVGVVGISSIACANPQTIGFSTYLGGSGSDKAYTGNQLAVDASGASYITGRTTSMDFPVTDGSTQSSRTGRTDAFITKIDSSGNIVYSTYIGGSSVERGTGIAVDATGAAYVVGYAASSDFPTTPGAYQSVNRGNDMFIVKLDSLGSVVYSTLFGGWYAYEDPSSMVVDDTGAVIFVGSTGSHDMPITPSAYQTSNHGMSDAFIVKLNPTGTALEFSTYLGGTGNETAYGVAVDDTGIYVSGIIINASNFPTTVGAFQRTSPGGYSAFVTKLDLSGSNLIYSTVIGGSGLDRPFGGLALDSAGAVYITGDTSSTDFPVTPGAFQTTFGGVEDAFVVKLNPSGSALEYATYIGGSFNDRADGITVNANGEAFIVGLTPSVNFPITADAIQPANAGGFDAFITRLSADGSNLIYSTYFGGATSTDWACDIQVDSAGTVYVSGQTSSSDFPSTLGVAYSGGGTDMFLVKFQDKAPNPQLGFTITKAKIKKDEFKIEGQLLHFLDPSNVDVIFAFDTWMYEISAGSFEAHDDHFKFKGGGVEAKFYRDGRFKIEAKHVGLEGLDLSGSIVFALKIGEYAGSADASLNPVKQERRERHVEARQERHEVKKSRGLFSRSERHKSQRSVFFGRAK